MGNRKSILTYNMQNPGIVEVHACHVNIRENIMVRMHLVQAGFIIRKGV